MVDSEYRRSLLEGCRRMMNMVRMMSNEKGSLKSLQIDLEVERKGRLKLEE